MELKPHVKSRAFTFCVSIKNFLLSLVIISNYFYLEHLVSWGKRGVFLWVGLVELGEMCGEV